MASGNGTALTNDTTTNNNTSANGGGSNATHGNGLGARDSLFDQMTYHATPRLIAGAGQPHLSYLRHQCYSFLTTLSCNTPPLSLNPSTHDPFSTFLLTTGKPLRFVTACPWRASQQSHRNYSSSTSGIVSLLTHTHTLYQYWFVNESLNTLTLYQTHQ